jgi:putative Flp pilus-assembly TadE/G-like protein
VAPTPAEQRDACVAPAAGRRLRALAHTSGQTLPLVVVFMFSILVFAGLVIDLGNAYRVQKALQASADASAAAGAGQLTMSFPPVAGNAITAARKYGSQTGGVNSITGVPSGNVTENVTATCVTQGQFTCTYPNTITVDEAANVPTYLLKLLGFGTITLKAHAQACSPCGVVPLDIALVMDRTGSMLDDSKLANLKTGLIQGFLPGLDPASDYVSLTLLPPDEHGTSDVCQAADNGAYDVSSPTYTVVPLSNTYMTPSGSLVANSPLVHDINCIQGGGGTDYANAMEAAYSELMADGRTGVQKVMVVLSDGAANTGQSCQTTTRTVRGRTVTTYDPDPHCEQPCQTAVNDSASYKANHVLMYSILYGDQSSGTACQTYHGPNESPAITSIQAMQQIASSNNYYPDPDPTNLKTIFQQIASDMAAGTSRLVQ